MIADFSELNFQIIERSHDIGVVEFFREQCSITFVDGTVKRFLQRRHFNVDDGFL